VLGRRVKVPKSLRSNIVATSLVAVVAAAAVTSAVAGVASTSFGSSSRAAIDRNLTGIASEHTRAGLFMVEATQQVLADKLVSDLNTLQSMASDAGGFR
jgi:hypothetical protein